MKIKSSDFQLYLTETLMTLLRQVPVLGMVIEYIDRIYTAKKLHDISQRIDNLEIIVPAQREQQLVNEHQSQEQITATENVRMVNQQTTNNLELCLKENNNQIILITIIIVIALVAMYLYKYSTPYILTLIEFIAPIRSAKATIEAEETWKKFSVVKAFFTSEFLSLGFAGTFAGIAGFMVDDPWVVIIFAVVGYVVAIFRNNTYDRKIELSNNRRINISNVVATILAISELAPESNALLLATTIGEFRDAKKAFKTKVKIMYCQNRHTKTYDDVNRIKKVLAL